MLVLEKFNAADQEKVEAIPRSLKAVLIFYSAILLPISFLGGLLGLLPKARGYWFATFSLVSFTTIVTTFYILITYYRYRKDLKWQKKYTGAILVIGKSRKDTSTEIVTDCPWFKKIALSEAAFDKIETGDQLIIDFSRHSRTLLKLEHNGESLLNNN